MAKKSFFKSMIAMIMVAFVTIVSNAQAVITNINAYDVDACKEYLIQNLTDTVKNIAVVNGDTITRRVFAEGRTLRITNDTVIKGVNRVKGGVNIISEIREDNGNVKTDTTHMIKTNTKDLAFETNVSILKGETKVQDPKNKDFDGNNRHKAQVTALGGGALVDDNITPSGTLRVAYESCLFLYELEGSVSSLKYQEGSEYEGKYLSYSVQANFGWKFLQDIRSRHYLALLVSGGYGINQSDGEEALARTRNYGFIAGATLRGSYGLTSHWRIVAEGGYKLFPKLPHDQQQDLSCRGFFVNLGVGYAW